MSDHRSGAGIARDEPYGDAALRLVAEFGWHVVPLAGKRPMPALGSSGGWKNASDDESQIMEWWKRWPTANVGVALLPSGLVALDVDVKDGGLGEEQLAALIKAHGDLPSTVEAISGSGGRHLLFRVPEGEFGVRGDLTKDVELKHKHLIVVPPSIHPETGDAYRWRDGHSPSDLDLAPWPSEWYARVRGATETTSARESTFTQDEAWTVEAGGVHEALVSLAGTMRQRLGVSPNEIEEMLAVLSPRMADGGGEDRAEHIRKVARSMAQYSPGTVPMEYQFPNGKGKTSKGKVLALPYSSIARERIRWLWKGRIARGEITLLVGDPGLGKSQFTNYQAAEVTRDGGKALMASAEDSPSYTIRPRLEAAGANLDNVYHLTLDQGDGIEGTIRLPDDIAQVRERIEQLDGIDLLVVDPLMAHMPVAVDAYRDQHVRTALAPLKRLADDFDCAVVVVMHLKKSGGDDNPLYRVGGSVGFGGAARSVLMLGRDPEDEQGEFGTSRIIANVKNNLAPLARSVRCEIETMSVAVADDSDAKFSLETTSRLVVIGECDIGAQALLAGPSSDTGAEKRDEASGFLINLLADGPVPAKEGRDRAKAAGISEATLDRARSKKTVIARQAKGKKHGGWWWFPSFWTEEQVDEVLTRIASGHHPRGSDAENPSDAGNSGAQYDATEGSGPHARTSDVLTSQDHESDDADGGAR